MKGKELEINEGRQEKILTKNKEKNRQTELPGIPTAQGLLKNKIFYNTSACMKLPYVIQI